MCYVRMPILKGLSDITAKWSTSFAEPGTGPDAQLFVGGIVGPQQCCSRTGAIGERISDRPRPIAFLPSILAPKSRGRIELNSTDPLQHPKIYANFFQDPQDSDALLDAVKWTIDLANTEALRPYNFTLVYSDGLACGRLGPGTDAYFKCAFRQTTGQLHHPAGTCKMGPQSDRFAVVDSKLRVSVIYICLKKIK